MSAINPANIKRTIYYLQRNGLRSTWYAVRERLEDKKTPPYVFEPPTAAQLAKQRETVRKNASRGAYDGITFSIVVPTYRTPPQYLRELIASVQIQSYPFWELILADATEDDSVKAIAEEFADGRINDGQHSQMQLGQTDDGQCAQMQPGQVVRYVRLSKNSGISGNTNEALEYVRNAYIALLDHDDILTPDALFEMAEAIRRGREQGESPRLIYSDEDKCDGGGIRFYEPNHKEKFNYDLILSNNYICHFMVAERDLMRKLRFRPEFDGAQDYDFILRAVTELEIPRLPERESLICHVPKVLYHWRCHAASTAENPRSKAFAYEAGRRALQEHIDQNGIAGEAAALKHVGFYCVKYSGENFSDAVFSARPDLGAVGGAVVRRGKIAGGRMDADGKVYFQGLCVHYSGYLHRAVLTQDAEAVDIRCIALRKELHGLFKKVTGVSYQCRTGESVFDVSLLPEDADLKALSLTLCRAIREQGYRILWCREESAKGGC